MKKITTLVLAICGFSQVNAQAVNDTVTTGAAYANNVWYSLENDDAGTQPWNNWDIAFATTISPSSELATSILFNHKMGSVYEIPGSNPTNFAALDTAGLSLLTPLFNSDTTWGNGAFNNTASLGSFDYGWGNYDNVAHTGITANRVFVIKYAGNVYKKLKIDLAFSTMSYTVTVSNLDNTSLQTDVVAITSYASKNFVYYSVASGVVDREPVSADWDLTFMQYPSFDFDPPFTVAGVLSNVGVEVAQAYPVADSSTYTNWQAHDFTTRMNEIGYDWKTHVGMGVYAYADSTVYFVKDKAGNLWKMIFTGFTSSSTGKYIFSKEKLETAGVAENVNTLLSVYPNPASTAVSVVADLTEPTTISIINQFGQVVSSTSSNGTGLVSTVLSLDGIENGVYYVRLQSQSSSTVKSLQVIR